MGGLKRDGDLLLDLHAGAVRQLCEELYGALT